jgi:hypothetical protein
MNTPAPKQSPQEIAAKLLDPKAYEDAQQKKEAASKVRAKKEELEKQAKAKIKDKHYFDVKIECLLPAVLTYRILAEDAAQALELIKGKSPNSVQHKLIGRKELAAKVYDAGSSMIRHMKKLLGA